MDVNGASQPFDANLRAVIKRHKKSAPGAAMPQELGSFEQMTSFGDAAVGVFRFDRVGTNYVIPRGFEIDDVTADAK